MSMRSDVLNCLRERLLNESESGRIFERDQDHLDWLVGSPEANRPGLLTDPAGALNQTIPRIAGDSGHPGVELNGEEAQQLRLAVAKASRAQTASFGSPHSGALIVAAATFLGPILANTGGY